MTPAETRALKDERANAIAIRLECLRMAVSLGSAVDVRAAAELYEDYILNGAKPAEEPAP